MFEVTITKEPKNPYKLGYASTFVVKARNESPAKAAREAINMFVANVSEAEARLAKRLVTHVVKALWRTPTTKPDFVGTIGRTPKRELIHVDLEPVAY